MEQKWTALQKELLLKSQVGAQNMPNLRVINKNQQWGKTVKLSVPILAVCKILITCPLLMAGTDVSKWQIAQIRKVRSRQK